MAEKNGETQPKKEHPAVTLSKKFESTRKEIGRLEHDGVEKNKDRIEELHREALDILKQMKELDDRSVRNIERDLRTSETIFYLEQQLNPIIEEAETVLSDAEIEEKAIRELLAETDKEKGEITARKAELQAEIKAEQQKEKEISEIEPPQPQSPKATVETIKPKRVKKPKQPKVNPPKAPVAQTPPEDPEVAPGVDQESWILQEVDAFIAEFGLEELLPPDFRKLKQEQQLKTIQDLKHRIVDIVKQDAKAHYNEAVGGEKARANIFGKLAIGVREAFKKETNIKNAEKTEFEKIKGTEEGRALVAEQMKLLAEINGGQEIVVGADGKLLIDYSEQLGIGTGSGQAELRAEYNTAANVFRSIPYEWGLAKEGSREKQEYDRAKDEYQKVVDAVLEVKRFMIGGKEQAIKNMMEISNSLTLEQLLNTHPDIEIELGKLEQGAGKEQVRETILRLAGIQNREKIALFAAGYGARFITKATLGAIAAPIVGAVFGGIRAKFKARDTLVERRKEARYGTKDASKEAEKFVEADKMANHIDSILNQLEQPNLTDEKRTSLEKRLQIRIDVALGKIKEGLLNFGNSKEAIAHQYKLTESLNRGLVRSVLFDAKTKKEVADRTSNIMSFRKEAISKAQQEYIEEQILMGALRGAGIATAGYIVRAIGESAGWWGGETPEARPYSEETADSKPFVDSKYIAEGSPELAKAEEYVAQAEKHYKNAQAYYDNATGEDKQAALEALNGAKAELDFQRKYLEGVANGTIVASEAPVDSVKSPIKTDTITRQPTYTQPKDTTITTTPETTVKYDSLEVASAKAREAQRIYEEALEKQRNAKTPGDYVSTENELARAKEEYLSANRKLEETAKAYREQKNAPQSEQSEPAKRTPETERPTTKAPKAERGEDKATTTENGDEKAKAKVNERPVKRVKRDTGSVEAKPRNIPSAPEVKDLPAGLDAKAVVGEGGGITFAFKQQLEGNNELAEALKKQIGFTGKIGTKAFYEALGKEFGYIKENGEWIGVKDGNVAAYQFEKNGDEYIVTEYHKINGVWKEDESHDMEGSFEGKDYEKEYEYLNRPKRVPASGDKGVDSDELAKGKDNSKGSLDNGQLNRAGKTEENDGDSGQLNRAPKPAKQDLDNGQLARAPKDADAGNPPRTKPEDDMRIRTRKVAEKEIVPPPENSRTVILESDKQDVKWRIEPGPPDGRPTVVEDFKLVGGKSLRMFADRYGYENLNTSQVDFVGQRYRFNLNKIFEHSEDWTDKWSKEPATRLLRVNVGDNVSGNKEKLANYIQMLYDEVKATGRTMKPFNDGFVGNKETTKDYILRMLFELEKRGKLDAFNDKFDDFTRGQDLSDIKRGESEIETVPNLENVGEFNPAKTEMYELWEKYKKQPESLSEEEYTFAEKVEGLREKNFYGILPNETAEHYLKRLESKTK